MKFIQTFESYLKGGRAPLYHFTYRLADIVRDDLMKMKKPAVDKLGNRTSDDRYLQLKSNSYTRSQTYSDGGQAARICLDTDLLIRHGYIPKPLDEVGVVANKNNSKSNAPRKFLSYTTPRKIHHNLDLKHKKTPVMEYEFEERIYKDIKNFGKYIIYIDIRDNINKYDLIEYVKKYPHIIIRKLNFQDRMVGDEIKSVPKEDSDNILLDINMINKKGKEKEKQVKVN